MLFVVDNMATVIVGMIIFVLFLIAILKIVRDKKRGKGCSCGCSECPSRSLCNKNEKKDDEK